MHKLVITLWLIIGKSGFTKSTDVRALPCATAQQMQQGGRSTHPCTTQHVRSCSSAVTVGPSARHGRECAQVRPRKRSKGWASQLRNDQEALPLIKDKPAAASSRTRADMFTRVAGLSGLCVCGGEGQVCAILLLQLVSTWQPMSRFA